MSFAAAALGYAKDGLRVFPCKPRGKEPLTPRGHLDASRDAATVAEWWEQTPDANIGVPCEANGLVVIDVDRRNGGRLTDVPKLFPRTWHVITGGGGHHIYLRHPGGRVRSTLGAGIDVKDRGYVIAPPSIHASGRAYEWHRRDAIPQLSAEAIRLLRVAPAAPARPIADRLEQGDRNRSLTSLAGTMRRRNASGDAIAAALTAENESRCDPPLAPEEVLGIARSVSRYPAAPPNMMIAGTAVLQATPDANLGGTVHQLRAITDELAAGTITLPFAPISQALANIPVAPEWTWDGLVGRRNVTLIAGPPKGGKTTLIAALLAKWCTGGELLGHRVHPAGALLLSEEPQTALQARRESFALTDQVHLLGRHDVPAAMTWPDVMGQAENYAHLNHLTVVIVDTIDKWLGLRGDQENSSGAVIEALAPITRAARSGLAVILNTHQRKGGGDYGAAVRGSNALVGAVDILIELERPRGITDERVRTLTTHSRYPTTPNHITGRLSDDGTTYTVTDPAALRADEDHDALLDALTTLGPATSTQLAHHTGRGGPLTRKRLAELHAADTITRTGTGKSGDPYLWTRKPRPHLHETPCGHDITQTA